MAEVPTLHEVRALLRAFARSDWRAAQVRAGDLEVWFSRDTSLRPEGSVASAEPLAIVAELKAPHLGTLAWLADPGTAIAAGSEYGGLRVLDEERALVAESGGVVAQHRRAAGDLIEYGEPLVALSG
jgi:biotin carboxyl carrier protein